MTNTELLLSDNYFKAHPENIMGAVGKGTTRWGEEISIVYSDEAVESIANRIIGTGIKPEQQPWHLTDVPAGKIKVGSDHKITDTDLSDQQRKIQEAIEKTKKQISSPPPTNGMALLTFDEIVSRYDGNISKDEIECWCWYQQGRMFSISAIKQKGNGWNQYYVAPKLQQWADAGILCYTGTEYMPAVLYYAGDIYKKLFNLNEYKAEIIDAIGKKNFETQLKRLEESIPEPLKIAVVESERLYITPLAPFASENFISSLSDGTVFDEETSLVNAYKIWLKSLSEQSFKYNSNSYEIINYFINRDSFPRGTEESEKSTIKRRSQQDGLALFSQFLFEALTLEDQQIIEQKWNRTYNSIREIDYNKIPVGFEMNKYFKNAAIDPRPAQWDGVRFLTANRSGIVAFDVGVGKTITAILAVAQALYTGQCKRPLIVVPNPTYKKWIAETIGEWNEDGTVKVNGLLPMYKDRINDFYNLGVGYAEHLAERWPKDYTITFITYQGLQQLGISEAQREKLGAELFSILDQGNLEGRDREKLREGVDKILGDVTSETVANFDDMGFDYIVVDEMHNFKNIFTRVKGRDEGEGERATSPYQLSSGEPSARGLKLFAFTQYVLRNNDMRNVVGLTATPFTNSPLEIYSMLALVAYQQLEKRGIVNLIDFFDQFINEENELSVTIKGKFENRPVIKTFNNRTVLQNIIFSSIIYRTGAEAGVPRPHKIVYPLLRDEKGIFLKPQDRIETALQPTHEQQIWLKEIAKFANASKGNAIEPHVPVSMYKDNDRNKILLGRDLLAISLAKSVTLSPYLLHIGEVDLYDEPKPTYKEFIASSPKLDYVMKCIKSVRDWHIKRGEPVSGQIIYMNMATEYFPMIKQYLQEVVGYGDKEVEIIIGGISQEKKEKVKEKFLAGEVKIIIGSATIKEGIDLQTRTTCLYNCNMDWNPTDIQQLEGRAWRQGNQHSYVRIVTPLIENSLDVFMFQKLEEKTSRINDIWYRKGRGNVLKLEDFDPKELKMGLMTDPAEKVKAEIELEVTRLATRKTVADGVVKRIEDAKVAIEKTQAAWAQINKTYDTAKSNLEITLKGWKNELSYPDISATDKESYESKVRNLEELLHRDKTDKTILGVCKRYAKIKMQENGGGYGWQSRHYYQIINDCDEQIKRLNMLESIQKNVLEPKGLTMADDLEPVIAEASAESADLQKEIERLKSDAYQNERIAEVNLEMKEKQKESRTINERVKEFERQNYLLSCLKGIHICDLETPVIKLAEKEKQSDSKESLDKAKRIRIAKAKAAALILLQEQFKQAA